jgi:outer membrane protein TolC
MCQSYFQLQVVNRKNRFSGLLCSCCLLLSANVSALNLAQAEQLAVKDDPSIESFRATSRSYVEESVADDTLPDPRLVLGAVNVPVDTFDLEQEPMTQLKVGIVQTFPRGDTLQLKQQQSQSLSRSASAMADDVRLKTISNVRETYLNLYYEVSAHQIISETRQLFSELANITESSYAAGRANQQDVLLADLELSRLDDRATKILASEEGYRARLAQWIGDIAWTPISAEFPELPAIPENVDLNQVIPRHPLIRAESAKVEASQKMTEMARQEYKPGWSASLDYGHRSGNNPDGTERADFASALVSLDIPLFTGNRQDKTVAANEEKIASARYAKDDKLRALKQQYETNQHLWLRLSERKRLYETRLLTSAKNNSRAALNAYQSGISEFNTLMRAQITELDVRLENLRIQVDRAIAQEKILYVIGDSDNESH